MEELLLDKYKIVRVVGHGGMGTVYEAQEVGSERHVAIKWMNAVAYDEDDPDLLRFKQEARIAGALDSPHVTAVFECARDPEKGVVFQVMELLEGEDLRALLDRVGPLLPATALRIAAQACKGSAAAHAAGVVHRDIKPENIFLARKADGEVVVKLLDFGIAKIRRTPENAGSLQELTAPAVPMTTSGQVLGTPLYMAPEQIDGAKHVDARCDVYSMGVTLYAMLTGAPPRAEIKSLMQLLHAITTGPAPAVTEQAPWTSAEIGAVVARAMSAEKEARYANSAELLAAIEALLVGDAVLRADSLVGMTVEEKKPATSSADMNARAKTTVVRDKPAVVMQRAKASPNRRVWVVIGVVLALAFALGAWAITR